MFSGPTQGQVIALAGLFQSCAAVDELARHGSVPNDVLETCLESLFIDSINPYDVFGGSTGLALGIETMQRLLTIEKASPQANILRYVIGVIQLAGRLLRHKRMLHEIATRLQNTQRMREHFPITHENIINNLAQLYQDTLSTFPYRIQVNGYAANLERKPVAARVRCLLFAAVRCAILWHRNGGRKRHLIFNRKQVLKLTKQLPA